MSVSPSGARIAMEFRGEILTVPAEKGDPRNITATTAVHERAPQWSPDGRSLAYFSDAGGEYALHIRAQDGKGEPKIVRLAGSGFYAAPVWSPDSQHIAFRDNGRTLYVLAVATGTISKVVTEPIYRPGAFSDTTCSWSPDSKWLVYTTTTRAQIQAARVWSVDKQASFPITDGLSDVSEPVFDRNGKYLYLFGSTDAGPVRDWFSQANADMRSTSAIYLVVLKKGEVSPLARESDEEKAEAATRERARKSGQKGRKGRKGREGRGGDGPSEPRPRHGHRHRRGSPPGSWRCRCPPATSRPCRPARPASCSSCGRPMASRRCSSSTSRPARPRRGCRRPTASSSPLMPRSCCTATARPSTWWSRRRRRTAARARSTSMPCRCASIRRLNGRRSSTRPGASTATTSTPPTITAATGRR